MKRLAVACLFPFFVAVLVSAADAPLYPPEQLESAKKTYKDVFGAMHDKLVRSGRLVEKNDFAKKLLERSRQVTGTDPALADLLRTNALLFTGRDKIGFDLALQIHRENLAIPAYKLTALGKVAESLEGLLPLSPASDRPRIFNEMLDTYRTLATEKEAAKDPAGAIAALGKAKAWIKQSPGSGNRDLVGAIESADRRLKTEGTIQADLATYREALKLQPANRKTNVLMGCVELSANQTKEAIPHLKASDIPEILALVKLLEAEKLDAVAVARSCVKASDALNDRKAALALLTFAKTSLKDRPADAKERVQWTLALIDVLKQLLVYCSTSDRATVSTTLAIAYLELAEAYSDAGNAEESNHLVAQARQKVKSAITLGSSESKPLYDDLLITDRLISARSALLAEVVRHRALEAAGKLDSRGKQELAMALLKLEQPAEAATAFAEVDSAPCRELAKVLTDEKAGLQALGNALRAVAAVVTRAEDRTYLLGLARTKYEAYLGSGQSKPEEKTRLDLLLQDLPTTPARPRRSLTTVGR